MPLLNDLLVSFGREIGSAYVIPLTPDTNLKNPDALTQGRLEMAYQQKAEQWMRYEPHPLFLRKLLLSQARHSALNGQSDT